MKTVPQRRPLRLVRFGRVVPEPRVEKPTQCNHVHVFATAGLGIRAGCRCGKYCVGGDGCDGRVVRRLHPVPGGFKEIPV